MNFMNVTDAFNAERNLISNDTTKQPINFFMRIVKPQITTPLQKSMLVSRRTFEPNYSSLSPTPDKTIDQKRSIIKNRTF